MSDHPDDVRLLSFAAEILDAAERRETASHIEHCELCRKTLGEIEALDTNLRRLAETGMLESDLLQDGLSPGDPFRVRPFPVSRQRGRYDTAALAASDAGLLESATILDRLWSSEGNLEPDFLGKDNLAQRFSLFYALQGAGLRIMKSPLKAKLLATIVLNADPPGPPGIELSPAESRLPWFLVRGQAHVLAGQAALWLKEFGEAGSHLAAAYAAFGRVGDESGVAIVELAESQRRVFLGEFRAALSLAQRCRLTFEARALDDLGARATVARGLALVELERFAEALAAYREALPVFEKAELWSNYVGCVNSLATALFRMGRVDEARREFARALRRFSREDHRSFLGYLQHGLGDLLLEAGKFGDAARAFSSASRHFAECGLVASALSSGLAEAQSWQEAGDTPRVKASLDAVARLMGNDQTLDNEVKTRIQESLARARKGDSEIGAVRSVVQEILGRLAS